MTKGMSLHFVKGDSDSATELLTDWPSRKTSP